MSMEAIERCLITLYRLLCAIGLLAICRPMVVLWCSQEEITVKVEMEYRLFLVIDMSLYRYKKIFLEGVQNFIHWLFRIQYGRQLPLKSLKRAITL